LHAEEVERMRDEALAAIAAADTLDALKQVRIDHVGDRSPLALANREIGALPPQARKEAGQRVGQARGAINQALAAKTAEVEAEWLNFDALNLGPDHPARTMQDTFWVTPERAAMVLRTHTSPVQARTMLTRKPPIYIACPGRVFRTDELDATHSPVFHQVEGLAIDEGLSMGHLKGTLDHFAQAIYGDGMTTRFRPSYFPFTEPSAEMDLLCYVCHNEPDAVADCRTCKGEGWVEWGGCGVVNPRVLIACGVDPERYSGFAFGIGIDRTITSRYDIADLRDLFDGDIRFTQPFGVEL
jgi:phenylalanyl-tRNA synthetase alpha chain